MTVIRVQELAAKMGVNSADLIAVLEKMGVRGKTPSSGLDDKESKMLIEKLKTMRREKAAASTKTIKESETTQLESPVRGPGAKSADRTVQETSDKTVAESSQTIVDQEQDHNFTSALTSFRDFPVLEQFPATGGEADIYLINQKGKKAILKLYRYGLEPKAEVLKRAQELSIEYPEHIIRIYEYGYDQKTKRWFEIQEYAEYDTLKDFAEKNDVKTHLRRIIEEIVGALKILNDHNLLHLDLKPSNILVRSVQPLDLIFTDFGIASLLDPEFSKKMTKIKGTPLYWSPEAFTGVVGKESDYWSLGMMILEILTGKHPFSGLDPNVIMFTLSTKGVAIPDDLSAEYVLLLKGLLTRDPKKRWGYEQITRWKAGERDIPVFYSYTEHKEGAYKKAYKFSGKEHYSLDELVASFVESSESWKDAISHVQRGYITKWLENNEDYDNSVKIEKIRDESRTDDNLSLLRIVYSFNKDLPFILLGKAITLQNLFVYVGKLIRKESTTEETIVAEAIVNGKFLNYLKDYIRVSGKAEGLFYDPYSNEDPEKTRVFRKYSYSDFTLLLDLLLKSVTTQEQNHKLMTVYNFLNIFVHCHDYIIPMDVHKDVQTEVDFIIANRDIIAKKETINALNRDYIFPKNLYDGIYSGDPIRYINSIEFLNRKQAESLLLSKEDYKSIQSKYVLPLGLIKSIESDDDSISFEGVKRLKEKQRNDYLLTKENLRNLQEQYIVPAELLSAIQSNDTIEYFSAVEKLRNMQLVEKKNYEALIADYIIPKEVSSGVNSEITAQYISAAACLKDSEHYRITKNDYVTIKEKWKMPKSILLGVNSDNYQEYKKSVIKLRQLQLLSHAEYEALSVDYLLPNELRKGLSSENDVEYEQALKKLKAIDPIKITWAELKKYNDEYYWPNELTVALKANNYDRHVTTLNKYRDMESRNLLISKKEYGSLKKQYILPGYVKKGIVSSTTDEYLKAAEFLRSNNLSSFKKNKSVFSVCFGIVMGGLIGYLVSSSLNNNYNPFASESFYSSFGLMSWLSISIGFMVVLYLVMRVSGHIKFATYNIITIATVFIFVSGAVLLGMKISEARGIFKYRTDQYLRHYFNNNQNAISTFDFRGKLDNYDWLHNNSTGNDLHVSASFQLWRKKHLNSVGGGSAYYPIEGNYSTLPNDRIFGYYLHKAETINYEPVSLSFNISTAKAGRFTRFGILFHNHMFLFDRDSTYIYEYLDTDANYAMVVKDNFKGRSEIHPNMVDHSDSEASIRGRLLTTEKNINWKSSSNKIDILYYKDKFIVKMNDTPVANMAVFSKSQGKNMNLVIEHQADFVISPVQVAQINPTADETVLLGSAIPSIDAESKRIRMVPVTSILRENIGVAKSKGSLVSDGTILLKGSKVEILGEEDGKYAFVRQGNLSGYCNIADASPYLLSFEKKTYELKSIAQAASMETAKEEPVATAAGKGKTSNRRESAHKRSHDKAYQITVSSSPTNATVYLNKKQVGKTPLSLKVQDGSYGIGIEKSGYKAKWAILKVTKDSPRSISYPLVKE